jgi:DNA-binding NarL/FixJ family response regulator
MSIAVVLADDHSILREGLRALLEQDPDLDVVGEAGDGRETVGVVGRLRPDVVVMDVAMPGLNGVDATRRIKAASPGVKVLALSVHTEAEFIHEMLHAGASGYVQKGCSVEELGRAIRTVAEGHTYLGPVAADVVASSYLRSPQPGHPPPPTTLTPREREVIQLIAEGGSAKQIAAALGVSVKTVSAHRRGAMDKLGLGGTADIVKYAIRAGLVSLDS